MESREAIEHLVTTFHIESPFVSAILEPRLEIKVHGCDQGAQIPLRDLEVLLSQARWELPPIFKRFGRSAESRRLEPCSVDDILVHGYQLKGIGFVNGMTAHPPFPQQYIPTLGNGIPRIVTHLGFDEKGNPIPILDSPKPLGGLSGGRGKREFENALFMKKYGVAAPLPVAWGAYDLLHWNHAPMEFVVLALHGAKHRVGECFESKRSEGSKMAALAPLLGVSDAMKVAITNRFGSFDEKQQYVHALQCFTEMMHAYGTAMRRFHEIGLLRYAGHLENISYDGRVTLHDLDSVIRSDEIPFVTLGISRVRDIASALGGILESYMHSGFLPEVDISDQENYNPFEAFLRGYFREEQEDEIGVKAAGLLGFLRNSLAEGFQASEESALQWYVNVLAERQLVCMTQVMPVYTASSLAATAPLPYCATCFKGLYEKYSEDADALREREIKRLLG